jgi:hypothetical protein
MVFLPGVFVLILEQAISGQPSAKTRALQIGLITVDLSP